MQKDIKDKINTKEKLRPLQHLFPAALTGLLIACAASAMKPAIASVPELLEYTAPEETKTTEKPKLKDADSLSKLAKSEKKNKTPEKEVDVFADQASYKDGTYTGSAQGFGGQISLQVVVKDGKISGITLLGAPGETASYLSQAMSVIDRIISAGSPNVDVVSGATYSSNGIINAVKRALVNAGGSQETTTIMELAPAAVDSTPAVLTPVTLDPYSITKEPETSLKDGNYIGSAQGFGGNITLQVTVSGGKISGISVVDASRETGSYFNKAQAIISRILQDQSAEVDTVSGATYSSTGIKNAVKNALSQAINRDQQASPSKDNQTASGSQEAGGSNSSTGSQDKDNPSSNPGQEDDSKENPSIQTIDLADLTTKPAKALQDGTFKGSGEGFGGDIEVEVSIQEGKLVQLKIVSAEDETPRYFNQAKLLLSDILKEQSTEVDVISGATFSSEGILQAVEEALKLSEIKEAGDGKEENEDQKDSEDQKDNEDQKDEESSKEEAPRLFTDGIFSANTLCRDEETIEDSMFWYRVNVSITIADGKIADVFVSKTDDLSEDPEDNESYFTYAQQGRTRKGVFYQGIPAQLLEKQSAEGLDTVSSATYTSHAMILAIQEALSQAKQ